MTYSVPVMEEARGETRKAIRSATSAAFAGRPIWPVRSIARVRPTLPAAALSRTVGAIAGVGPTLAAAALSRSRRLIGTIACAWPAVTGTALPGTIRSLGSIARAGPAFLQSASDGLAEAS